MPVEADIIGERSVRSSPATTGGRKAMQRVATRESPGTAPPSYRA